MILRIFIDLLAQVGTPPFGLLGLANAGNPGTPYLLSVGTNTLRGECSLQRYRTSLIRQFVIAYRVGVSVTQFTGIVATPAAHGVIVE